MRAVAHKGISEIRIVGGHPALDFVNTVDARRDRWGPDALTSFQDMVTWGERVSLVSAEEAGQLAQQARASFDGATRALENALAGRELIYRVFLAEARSVEPALADVSGLITLVETANCARQLKFADESYRWDWRPSDLNTILHRVVLSAAELLVDRTRRKVRECTGLNCGWLFLDQSKNGCRTWCSEAGCGTRERVRRKRIADKFR